MSESLTETEWFNLNTAIKMNVVSPSLTEKELWRLTNKAIYVKFGEIIDLFSILPDEIASDLTKHYAGILNDIKSKEPRP